MTGTVPHTVTDAVADVQTHLKAGPTQLRGKSVSRREGANPGADLPESQPEDPPPAWLAIRPSAARARRAGPTTESARESRSGRSSSPVDGAAGRALPGPGCSWGHPGQGSRPSLPSGDPTLPRSEVPAHPRESAGRVPKRAASLAPRLLRPQGLVPEWSPGTPPKRFRRLPPGGARPGPALGPPLWLYPLAPLEGLRSLGRRPGCPLSRRCWPS